MPSGSMTEGETYAPRHLSDWMLGQFAGEDGLLHPILEVVRRDPELDLDQLRPFPSGSSGRQG
jgi:hypothetical protein